MREHAQAHALCIQFLACGCCDKAVLGAFHLAQVLIGQPVPLSTLRKIDQYLLGARQDTLLHDAANTQRAHTCTGSRILNIHAVLETRANQAGVNHALGALRHEPTHLQLGATVSVSHLDHAVTVLFAAGQGLANPAAGNMGKTLIRHRLRSPCSFAWPLNTHLQEWACHSHSS